MDPAIVINIYLNQDGSLAVSGASRAAAPAGPSGTDIPPPPSPDQGQAAAVDEIPSPPSAAMDQTAEQPLAPPTLSAESGQDVPPPPGADEPGAGPVTGDVPPPPDE